MKPSPEMTMSLHLGWGLERALEQALEKWGGRGTLATLGPDGTLPSSGVWGSQMDREGYVCVV